MRTLGTRTGPVAFDLAISTGVAGLTRASAHHCLEENGERNPTNDNQDGLERAVLQENAGSESGQPPLYTSITLLLYIDSCLFKSG